MEKLPSPVKVQHDQAEIPAIGPPVRPIGIYARGNAEKDVDTKENDRIDYGQMTHTHDMRVRMALDMHKMVKRCSATLGYTSVAEFVRVAIQEKIRKDCSDLNILVEDIEESKK